MASTPTLPHSDPFMAAVARTLSEEIRGTLKGPLMDIAEAEVDKAVDRAMAEIDIRIKSWVDTQNMDTTIKIIVERRSADAKQT